MHFVERFISPFIAQQFPSFYKEQGPNFIAFVKAYYEWLEQSNNAIGHARLLLDHNDIDETDDQFLKYFKNQYLLSVPEDAAVDKRLMLKHIQELYKAKGSRRAIELLFRLVYGEDVEIFVPNEYLFKPSDNIWKVPQYIETTSNPKLNLLIGTEIKNPANSAIAIVENVSQRIVNGKTVNILEITPVKGTFLRGERILQAYGTNITANDTVIITGSLTAVGVSAGGRDYAVGDILKISGAGIEGKARVSSISNNFSGALNFSIIDGGSGYTTNAIVSVKTTINLNLSDVQGTINLGDSIYEANTFANGIISFIDSGSSIQLIDFSNTAFNVGNRIIGPTGNAAITRVLGGVGSGASFRVGQLTNKELVSYNTVVIEPFYNVALERQANSFTVNVSSVVGTFNTNDTVRAAVNVVILEGLTLTTTTVANGENLGNTSLGLSLRVYRSDVNLMHCSGTEANLDSTSLTSGTILAGSSSGALFQIKNKPSKYTANVEATVLSYSASPASINFSSVNGYFIETSTLNNITRPGNSAIVTDVIRSTDWNIPQSAVLTDNLDSRLDQSLKITTVEIGTIASLAQVQPGANYLTKPHINVFEPEIASLLLFDSAGRVKGNNATIDSNIVGGNGQITAVEVINSGYGYEDNETVILSKDNNDSAVYGSAIVSRTGKGDGRWLNRKSFPDDMIKIQDSFFYQDYSYQIIAKRMLSTYENLVRDLVHPAGMGLFGAFKSQALEISHEDTIQETSIDQTTINFYDPLIGPYEDLNLDASAQTFLLTTTSRVGTFAANDTIRSSANVVFLRATKLSSGNVQLGETLSNNVLGITGLFVYRSDGGEVYCTGTDPNLTNANLVANVVLSSNITFSIIRINNTPTKFQANAEGLIIASNSTTLTMSVNNGSYYVRTANLTNANTGGTAVIAGVERLTNWEIDTSIAIKDNLDTQVLQIMPVIEE